MKKIILFFILLFIPFFIYAEKCDTNEISIKSVILDNKTENVEIKNEALVDENNNIRLNLGMSEVGDKVDYSIVVKNDSKEDFVIDQNSFNVDSNYIKYTISTDDNSYTVKGNSEKTVHLLVEYKNEIPENNYNNGKYNDEKAVTINLTQKDSSNNSIIDKIINPYTGTISTVINIVVVLIVSLTIFFIVNKAKNNKFFSILLLLIIPISIYAECKMDICVNSNIEITKKVDSFLMAQIEGDEESNFFRTSFKKNQIEKITFVNNINGHTPNGTNCFDVSRDSDGSTLAWFVDSDNNGFYEVTIGGNKKVYATDGKGLFSHLSNLTTIEGINILDTSNVTDMSYMFAETPSISSLDVSYFNTSKVTNMSYMFNNCSELKTIYSSDNFKTNNVTESSNMFTNSNKLVGGKGTIYDGNHTNKEYAIIDEGETNPGYFTQPGTIKATIYYNSNNIPGEFTLAQKDVYCTQEQGQDTCNITIPNIVSESVGKYNGTFSGVSKTLNNLDNTLSISNNDKLYAFYQANVSYYEINTNQQTLYRNEFFTSENETKTVLSENTKGLTNISAPLNDFQGFSNDSNPVILFNTVEEAANSSITTLYSVHRFIIEYAVGNNVTSIEKESDSCNYTSGLLSCKATLPSITPSEGYNASGWAISAGSNITYAPGSEYTITSNAKLYANAVNYNYQNTTTGSYYGTLNEAFNAVVNDQIIKALSDTTETIQVILASGKTGVKLDLNGKTITMNDSYITNRGTLDIYNTSSTTGTITGGSYQVIENSGTLTLNGTSTTNKIIIEKTANNNDNGAVNNIDLRSLTINDNVEIKANASSSPGINNSGTTVITGGTISASTCGINNQFRGQLEISGYSTSITATGTFSPGIDNHGTLTVTGGTITGSYGIQNGNSRVNGSIYFGTVTIIGGTITGSRYAVSNNGGSLTLGTNDSTVSTNSPLIQTTGTSNIYGVNNVSDGTFNFYDGIIKSSSGTDYAIGGTISDIPTGYQVYKETIDGVESAYLVKIPMLMAGTYGTVLSNYLRTSIARQDIESLTFSNSLGNHIVNGTDCWDVSLDEDGTVLAWVTDNDSNGSYEMTIGANGTIYASNGQYLFDDLMNLVSLNGMNNLDTSKVTNMNNMFSATAYNSPSFTLDLGDKFDTSKVTSMNGMFFDTGYRSGNFTLKLGDKFDTKNVVNMNSMFRNTGYTSTKFTLDLGDKFDTTKVTDMKSMFYQTGHTNSKFTLDLGNKFNTSNVTNMNSMFYQTGYYSTVFTLDLGDKFDTTNVTDMSSMFSYTGMSSTVFTLDLGNKFNTSSVTNMGSMFYYTAFKTTVFTLDLGNNFNTSNVTNMNSMFYQTGYYSTVLTLDLGDKFDTTNVTNMQKLFYQTGYSSTVFTLNLGNKFNTSNVVNMNSMFSHTGYSSTVFTLDLGDKFNTAKVTNMNSMFYRTGYSSLVFTLDLGDKFDTANVTDMGNMFYQTGYSSTIFTLNLGNKFNTTKVTSMSYMFSYLGASNTKFTLDLGNKFNTANVIYMSGMFSEIANNTSNFILDLRIFDTSKVKNMVDMFAQASKLKTIYVNNNFNTSALLYSDNMFAGCTSLVGGNGTTYNSSYVDATYARIDTSGTSGYFTKLEGNVAKFHYNPSNNMGVFVPAVEYVNCTPEEGQSSCTVSVPSVVSNSVGKYNSAYAGVSSSIGNLTSGSLTISSSIDLYAYYSSGVVNHYYRNGDYVTKPIYKNEFFTSNTKMNSVYASSSTGTTNITSEETGPNASEFVGYSNDGDSTVEYESITEALNSNTNVLYSVYKYTINYEKGAHVSDIGASSGSCNIISNSDSCTVILPTITAETGYTENGWGINIGDTTGISPLTPYLLNSNYNVLYANAS